MNSIKNIQRKIAPKVNNRSTLKLKEPGKYSFSNGLEVFLFEDKSQEAVRFDLMFKTGSACQEKALVAGAANRLLKEGSEKYKAAAVHSKVDYHGAYLDLQTTKDYGFLSLYSLSKSLKALLPLVSDMVKKPVFDKKHFDLYMQRQKQDFLISSEKTKHLANRIFTAKLYGEQTPYGKVAQLSDFDHLNTKDLHHFHQKNCNPATSKMLISGPVGEKILPMLESLFGPCWESKEIAADFDQKTSFSPDYFFQSKGGALQSTVMMGRPVMERSHPDYPGFLLLNTILGGYFGSRLMANIREEKGYTYGIHSMVSPMRKATGLTIATEVGTKFTQSTIKEIKKELVKLQQEKVKETELQLVKNYLTGTYLRSLDGVYNQADKYRVTIEHNTGLKYFSQSLEAINAVNSSELLALAQKYLSPEEMLVVVAGAEG